MKLDRIDKKFSKLGFVKVTDDQYIVQYEKNIQKYGYTHCLDIMHKASGRHLIQSFQKESDIKDQFNIMVGLTGEETRLALKKMKKKKWKARNEKLKADWMRWIVDEMRKQKNYRRRRCGLDKYENTGN